MPRPGEELCSGLATIRDDAKGAGAWVRSSSSRIARHERSQVSGRPPRQSPRRAFASCPVVGLEEAGSTGSRDDSCRWPGRYAPRARGPGGGGGSWSRDFCQSSDVPTRSSVARSSPPKFVRTDRYGVRFSRGQISSPATAASASPPTGAQSSSSADQATRSSSPIGKRIAPQADAFSARPRARVEDEAVHSDTRRSRPRPSSPRGGKEWIGLHSIRVPSEPRSPVKVKTCLGVSRATRRPRGRRRST